MIVTDPKQIDAMLLEGQRIVDIMGRSLWPRKNVLARARLLGMLVNPVTDKPYVVRRSVDEPEPSLKDQAQALIAARKTEESPVAESQSTLSIQSQPSNRDTWGEILAAGLQSTNPTIKRKAELAMAGLQVLRETIANERAVAKVRAEIERRAQELAELREKARAMGVRPLGAPKAERTDAQRLAAIESNRNRSRERAARLEGMGTTSEEVREWCRANDVQVSAYGWLSNASLDAYEQAHQGAAESA